MYKVVSLFDGIGAGRHVHTDGKYITTYRQIDDERLKEYMESYEYFTVSLKQIVSKQEEINKIVINIIQQFLFTGC